MNNERGNNWYLIFTKVKSEFKAKEHLDRQGYITYLPIIQKERRRGDKKIVSMEAFFPRYLFILLNQKTDNWRPISSTIGVSRIVRFGGIPAIVPKYIIDCLKLREDQGGLQPNPNSHQLTKGDTVMVVNGPFAGQQGIYQKLKGSERVAILLDIVGKNTQVTLSMHDLEQIE